MADNVRELTHLANEDMMAGTRHLNSGFYTEAAMCFARASAMRAAAILILLDRQSASGERNTP